MPHSVHHTTIVSGCARELIAVLHEVVGLPIVDEHEVTLEDVSELFGWDGSGSTAKVTMLGGADHGLVEVVEVPGAAPPLASRRPDAGIVQIAFLVRDLVAALQQVDTFATAEVHGPVDVTVGGTQARVATVRIGGVQVQLAQVGGADGNSDPPQEPGPRRT